MAFRKCYVSNSALKNINGTALKTVPEVVKNEIFQLSCYKSSKLIPYDAPTTAILLDSESFPKIKTQNERSFENDFLKLLILFRVFQRSIHP